MTEGLRKGWRNNTGRTTMRGGRKPAIGCGFQAPQDDSPATVERLEYDPNRTAFIALILPDGEQSISWRRNGCAPVTWSCRASGGLKAGKRCRSGHAAGKRLPQCRMKPGKAARSRARPHLVQLVGREQACLLRMTSGEMRMVARMPRHDRRRIGTRPPEHRDRPRPGRNRWLGRRPRSRRRPR